MRKDTSPMRVLLASIIALSFSLGILLPRDAQALDLFKWFRSKNKVEVTVSKKREMNLARNVKLVNTMRAFRIAPPELKDLVAAIITSSKMGTLAELKVQDLDSFKTLRKNVATTGLPSIQSGLMKARGTEFKTALVIILANLLDDKTLDASMRQKILLTLEESALTPYRFGDRHQFVALVVLTRQLDKAHYEAFAQQFIKAHRGGKDSALQLSIYKNSLKDMKAKMIKQKEQQ